MSDPEVADRGSRPIPTRMVMSTEVNMKYRLQFATELNKDGGTTQNICPFKTAEPNNTTNTAYKKVVHHQRP